MCALSLINIDLLLKITIQLDPDPTWLFLVPCYFELKTISLRFALQSFNISYFELPPFQTIFHSPLEFRMPGFNCTLSCSD